MDHQLAVDSLQPGNGKDNETPLFKEPLFVRIMAHTVSILFHPLFIPAYVAGFVIYLHPYAYAGIPDKFKMFRLLSIVVSTSLLPAFSVFLLWRLDFIQSIYLRTQRERIIPYAIALIFYFWVWYVFKNLPDSPLVMKQFLLGVFLAVCGSWMANIFFKVSMHGAAVGGLIMFFLLQSIKDPVLGGSYLAMAIFITGLVCTARLIVGGHSRQEVYSGLVIGALAQYVATWF